MFDRHPLYSARRPAPVRFRRSDYLGDPDAPLAESARRLVAERTGHRPEGPVRLLTHLRYLGHSFNPVSFYYLYDRAGERVDAVIAEVTNIPWRERHAYVVERNGSGPIRGRFAKRLHVSPFMPMEQAYDWRITEPGDALDVRIASVERGKRVFDATLAMRRRELSPALMTRVLLTYPPMSLAVPGRIYANALRLKLKGARYHRHDRARAAGGGDLSSLERGSRGDDRAGRAPRRPRCAGADAQRPARSAGGVERRAPLLWSRGCGAPRRDHGALARTSTGSSRGSAASASVRPTPRASGTPTTSSPCFGSVPASFAAAIAFAAAWPHWFAPCNGSRRYPC